MYVLNIAEKNSVAKQISYILANGRPKNAPTISKYNPVFQFQMPDQNYKMKFSSVRGHIIQYYFPEYYKIWNRFNPKVLLKQVQIIKRPSPDNHDIVKNLESLVRNSSLLILWLDCDRQGQAIAFQVIQICKKIKPSIKIKRARFSAVTKRDILYAYNNLIDPNKLQSQAVQYRRQIDFRLGCSFTILQTLTFQNNIKKSEGIISYGPCQFPTLGFVVQRYLKVINFKPQSFWTIKCWYQQNNKNIQFKWKKDKIFDEEIANYLFIMIFEHFQNKVPLGIITKTDKSIKKKFKPYPLATITLQKLGTQKLRMSSDKIMEHAQKLYQKGILSYPRTQTNSFPSTMNLKNIIKQFSNHSIYGQYATKLLQTHYAHPKNGGKSDQAHPPIHPVKAISKQQVTPEQWKVYDLICRHFLACCSKDAQAEQLILTLNVANEDFTAKNLKIKQLNYLEIYTFQRWLENQIPQIPDKITPQLDLIESKTSAPNYLTESQLIGLMDKNQIGTDSTIHQHIKTILTRRFAIKTNNTFKPTSLGLSLVQTYDEMGIELSRCDIRRNIEQLMKKICNNQITRQDAVNLTLSKMIPIFERLQTQKNLWISLVKKYLPNENDNNIDQLQFGSCGYCNSRLSFSQNSIICEECNLTLHLPLGKIKVTDFNCPICKFLCIQIYNQHFKKYQNICPKCYNQPQKQYLVDKSLNRLQCSKCTYNCRFAKGLSQIQLFDCILCKIKKVKLKQKNGSYFLGCSNFPNCRWSISLINQITKIKIINQNCIKCSEIKLIQSPLAMIGFKQQIDILEIKIKFYEQLDNNQNPQHLVKFCLNPQCSPFLFIYQAWRNHNDNNNNYSNSNNNYSNSNKSNKRTITCYNCNQEGHFANQCKQQKKKYENKLKYQQKHNSSFTQRNNKIKNNQKPNSCFKCHEEGHYANNCPNKNKTYSIQNNNTQQYSHSQNKTICFTCRQQGHISPNCPNNSNNNNNSFTNKYNRNKSANQQKVKGKKLCIKCGVGRHKNNSKCEIFLKNKRNKKQQTGQEDEQN